MNGEVLNSEVWLLDALRDGDWPAVDELLAEDMLITTAGWLREPVDEITWMREVRNQHSLHSYEVTDSHVRRYGSVIIVLLLSRQRGARHGHPWDATLRYTDIWTQRGPMWRLSIRHASVVPTE